MRRSTKWRQMSKNQRSRICLLLTWPTTRPTQPSTKEQPIKSASSTTMSKLKAASKRIWRIHQLKKKAKRRKRLLSTLLPPRSILWTCCPAIASLSSKELRPSPSTTTDNSCLRSSSVKPRDRQTSNMANPCQVPRNPRVRALNQSALRGRSTLSRSRKKKQPLTWLWTLSFQWCVGCRSTQVRTKAPVI